MLKRIVQAMVVLLSFFQLKFRIPERGMVMLLVLVRGLLNTIANLAPSIASIQWLKDHFPPSLYLLRKQSGVSNQKLKEYVICLKCHRMYDAKQCYNRTPTGTIESKKCEHVQFPNHTHRSRTVKCNTILMKPIKRGSAYSKKTYRSH